MLDKYGFVLNIPASMVGIDEVRFVGYELERPGSLVSIRKLGAGERALNDIAINRLVAGHHNIMTYKEVILRNGHIYIVTEYGFTNMAHLSVVEMMQLKSMLAQAIYLLIYLRDAVRVTHGAFGPSNLWLINTEPEEVLVYGNMRVGGARLVAGDWRGARLEHRGDSEGGLGVDRKAMAECFSWLVKNRKIGDMTEEDLKQIKEVIGVIRDSKQELSTALVSPLFDIFRNRGCTQR